VLDVSLVLLTGGARSGKSSAAQRLAVRRAAEGADVVVAVFGRCDGDEEFATRLARHRSDRPVQLATLEARDSRTWLGEVDDAAVLVVECLGTLVGRVQEEEWARHYSAALAQAQRDTLSPEYERAVAEQADALVEALVARRGDTIVVTNEVGDGVVPSYASGRLFRDVMGRCNRRLVDVADAAYLVIAGRLVRLDTLGRDVAWPAD
jgi:adenosyl cobinamide kinase/adenosyl cobinamide phosphate guanylyltransferase